MTGGVCLVRCCVNCVFGRGAEGLSGRKRVCVKKVHSDERLVIVDSGSHCGDHYVSHLTMIRENGGDAKYKGARVIRLTKGMHTLVDECDYERLSQYKWYMAKSERNYYAVRNSGRKRIRMHREITGAPEDKVVDHIDNDGLNNRRSNLRVCTHKQNSRNARSHKGTSKYKGVCLHKQYGKWQTAIGCDGKKVLIGYFDDETEAAKAYDEYARKLFGEYAYLNFPEL